jgi:hypothetical protein
VRFGRLPSVLVAVVLALTVIAGVGTLIGTQIAERTNALPQYQAAIEKKIGRVQEVTVGHADSLIATVSGAFKRRGPGAGPAHVWGLCLVAPDGEGADAGRAVQEAPVTPVALGLRFLAPVISPPVTTGLVLVVAIFIGAFVCTRHWLHWFTSSGDEDAHESRGTTAFAASTFSQLIEHLLVLDHGLDPSGRSFPARAESSGSGRAGSIAGLILHN